MSQTKIEVTAETQQAEAQYKKLTAAQDQQEAGAQSLASTTQQTERQIAAAREASASKGAASYNRIIRELKKQGPEGRAQAKALEQYLRDTGTAGRRSIGEIVGELETFDPAAAAAATAIKNDIGSAATVSGEKLAMLASELSRLGPEGRKQATAIRQYLNQTGQDGRRSINTILSEVAKIDDEAAKVATNATSDFQTAGKAGQDAFGAGIRSQLLQMATDYISINAAASIYRRTVEAARDAAKQSVETLLDTTSGNQKLLQVATDAEDFEALTRKADDLAATYGILREQARDLVFSARSEGFEGLTDFIAQNAGNRVIDVQAQATVAGQVPNLFQKEGISGQEAINAVLVGAAESRLNFEEIARALPAVAASAAPTEASFDESVATLSVLAGKFKSGETAADRIAALAAKLNLDVADVGPESDKKFAKRIADETGKKKYREETDAKYIARVGASSGLTRQTGRAALADRGLIEAVVALRDEFTEDQRAEFLGESKELNEAYNAIAENLNTITERTAKINAARAATGTAQSPTALKRAIAEQTPAITASRDKIAADNTAEIESERALAVAEAKRQTERATQRADEIRRGDNQVAVETRSFFRETGDFLLEAFDGVFEAIDPQYQAIASDAQSALSDQAFADPETQRKLKAIVFGATQFSARQSAAKLGERPQLSSAETQIYLETLTGETFTEEQITDKVIKQVTEQIRSLGTVSGGRAPFLNTLPISNFLGYNRPRQQELIDAVQTPELTGRDAETTVTRATTATTPPAEPASTATIATPAPATTPNAQSNQELTDALRENNRLQRESLELQRQTAAASQSTASATRDTATAAQNTATNTKPQPPDATAQINAASSRRIPEPI